MTGSKTARKWLPKWKKMISYLFIGCTYLLDKFICWSIMANLIGIYGFLIGNFDLYKLDVWVIIEKRIITKIICND